MSTVISRLRRVLRKASDVVPGRFDLDTALSDLRQERDSSPVPHEINQRMNAMELEAGREELLSYPIYMAMNLIGVCNARCRFCFYGDDIIDKSVLKLEDIQRMPWLRFVSTLDLFGGLGEPLLLPDFPDIVEWLHEQNPAQTLLTTSNGAFLASPVAGRLAGKLSNLNISLNAATRATYEHLMLNCSWDRVMKNLQEFQEINQATTRPTRLSFSYVATRSNIEELPKLAEVAKDLGVASVGISHFSLGGVWAKRKEPRLSMDESLYFHQNLSDECIRKAEAAFAKAKVSFSHPELFSRETEIHLGTRVPRNSANGPDCPSPWQTAYINPHKQSRWVSCCCSVNAMHQDMTPLDLEDTDFMRTWNSPVFRLMRRGVNEHPCRLINCAFCRSHDKSAPDSAAPQLEMMIKATEQYHDLLGQQPSDAVIKEKCECEHRIGELQSGIKSL